ncbi:MAG TPA: C1 family peptidase, partial [Longimicrobium sp.]|nr:C1 family peptidase [Longimicrobium sp.]
YDPGFIETIPVVEPDLVDALPPRAEVNPRYLPPVGAQGRLDDCTAWASTYGLATFTAARAGDYSPDTPDLVASPTYIYIKVMEQEGRSTCVGSPFTPYFSILDAGGTPTLAQAPDAESCAALWTEYGGSNTLPPDAAFNVGKVAAFKPNNLLGIKSILSRGGALVFATELYTDFQAYRGTPVPYVGNGVYLPGEGPTNRHAAHCMMIVAYDDDIGAFKIQNSWGTGWGENGFVWMAYDTFTALAVTVMYVVTEAA